MRGKQNRQKPFSCGVGQGLDIEQTSSKYLQSHSFPGLVTPKAGQTCVCCSEVGWGGLGRKRKSPPLGLWLWLAWLKRTLLPVDCTSWLLGFCTPALSLQDADMSQKICGSSAVSWPLLTTHPPPLLESLQDFLIIFLQDKLPRL